MLITEFVVILLFMVVLARPGQGGARKSLELLVPESKDGDGGGGGADRDTHWLVPVCALTRSEPTALGYRDSTLPSSATWLGP